MSPTLYVCLSTHVCVSVYDYVSRRETCVCSFMHIRGFYSVLVYIHGLWVVKYVLLSECTQTWS